MCRLSPAKKLGFTFSGNVIKASEKICLSKYEELKVSAVFKQILCDF